jgi:hypothetical protein
MCLRSNPHLNWFSIKICRPKWAWVLHFLLDIRQTIFKWMCWFFYAHWWWISHGFIWLFPEDLRSLSLMLVSQINSFKTRDKLILYLIVWIQRRIQRFKFFQGWVDIFLVLILLNNRVRCLKTLKFRIWELLGYSLLFWSNFIQCSNHFLGHWITHSNLDSILFSWSLNYLTLDIIRNMVRF